MFPENAYPFWISYVVNSLRRSWGFLNLLAYWFLSPAKEETKEDLFEEEVTVHESFMSDMRSANETNLSRIV